VFVTERWFEGGGERFGGCFVGETLVAPLVELERTWLELRAEPRFVAELAELLADLAGRPTPLRRASNLGARLGCELLLKREDLLHTGAHKLNNALGQCLLARRSGRRRVVAETGAGQHGVATATAAAALGLECEVHMGARDAERQALNVQRMALLGARVVTTEAGDATLKEAVGEALRAWSEDPLGTHYVLGSALGPHPYPRIVADFQRVIGDEARAQCLARGGLPDAVVASVGGGSNAIGIFKAFEQDAVELIGVEAGGSGGVGAPHAARMRSGRVGVLHGARSRVLCDGDGRVLATGSISAGLDYASIGPEHAALAARGRAEYGTACDDDVLAAARLMARCEGILPALESAHALAWLQAHAARFAGRRVLVCVSGRGDKDLSTLLQGLEGTR
jgi:tryptophan synthase beta chain